MHRRAVKTTWQVRCFISYTRHLEGRDRVAFPINFYTGFSTMLYLLQILNKHKLTEYENLVLFALQHTCSCCICVSLDYLGGFPGDSVVKNLSANAGDEGGVGSILGSGRSPGGENGNPLQYSCLKNPMDRGAWRATIHGVAKSQT